MRRALALAVLALPVPAAGSPLGGAVIAATAYHGGRSTSDIVLLDETGAIVANLTPGEDTVAEDRQPAWSPDGSRLAFVSRRDGPRAEEIYVIRADGSDQQRLTADSGSGRVFNTSPAWSPDGARIAFLKTRGGRYEIWVMNADGSDQRALAADGEYKSAAQWSPDGALLLYGGGRRVFVVDLQGSRRALTPAGSTDHSPAWSPNGRMIAFVSGGSVHVTNADGTGRRAVSGVHDALAPMWSPDGTRILFSTSRYFSEYSTRYTPVYMRSAWAVGVDGSGETRLTGPPDEDYRPQHPGAVVGWWPDGSRLFTGGNGFSPRPSLWVLNADGSCERRWGPADVELFGAAWRPGARPALPPSRCSDVGVDGRGPGRVALLDRPVLSAVVWNDGNETATGVRLRVRAARGVLEFESGGCGSGWEITCDLGPLAPGQVVRFHLAMRVVGPGTAPLSLTVESPRPDGNAANDAATVYSYVVSCTHVGTGAADRIEGTGGSDRICALGGDDRIEALAGTDRIEAGAGRDTVDAGPGIDVVFGQDGRDRIHVRDGERDTVDCGAQLDVVVGDRRDVVRRCEVVQRAPAAT